ncbi:MAG: N-6 DNA methylase [Bacteroidota bacterium]
MKIKDFLTGKPVDISKPEEKVRQEFEQILHTDYFYDKDRMDIEVPIKIGSSKKRADIVIYKHSKNKEQYKDILAIVEVKQKSRRDGVAQLSSYMQATSAIFGVWTNGDEITYLYKEGNEIKDDVLVNIPKQDEDIANIGDITKEKLRSVRNLKPIFRRILKTLYANTNISRKEKLGSEMIKLIFCKIHDELHNLHALPKFRVSKEELERHAYEEVKDRLQGIFSEVKERLKGDGIFLKNETILLDPKSVVHVVGELAFISLSKTEKDAIGEAFEVFAESKLVGEKGEFFTPREIIKLAIQIIDPAPEESIIDPACGSGGFLIYALSYIWQKMEKDRKYKNSPKLADIKRKIAENYFYGIEKEVDLVRICKAYMTIIGDGTSKIIQQNTLKPIHEFNPKAKEHYTEKKEGKLTIKKFDYVITNPPFGAKIKVIKEDCKYFDLGHKWKKKEGVFEKTNTVQETSPQELFIERCLQMLKSGGKLAIVLPETYLHAPSKKYVLQYLKKNNNIISVIDLPHNTFRPYCNAKTCLIVLQKNRPQQSNIIMGVAEQMGHDHKGDLMYRFDKNTKEFTKDIWDDTEIISKELVSPSKNNKYVFHVQSSAIVKDYFVPRYYWNTKIKEAKAKAKKANMHLISLRELLEKNILHSYNGHGSPPSQYKGQGNIPYIRVADIVNWDVYKNPTSMIPAHIYSDIKGANGIDLQEKDILFVRRGSYRIGAVAMISSFDKNVLLTNEITVLRISSNDIGLSPYYLLFALSHEITQLQINNKVFIDTTLPNIGERWKELKIPVFNDQKELERISKKILHIMQARWQANQTLHQIAQKFGGLTM